MRLRGGRAGWKGPVNEVCHCRGCGGRRWRREGGEVGKMVTKSRSVVVDPAVGGVFGESLLDCVDCAGEVRLC